MYNAPISASAADDMTCLMIDALLWMAPLFAGLVTFSESMTSCPLFIDVTCIDVNGKNHVTHTVSGECVAC